MKEAQRYVIYARGHRPPDAHSRHYVPVFTDPIYAKAWLDFFLDGEETVRDGDTILLGCGVKLKSEQLDTIVSCKDTTELKDVDERRILRFKHGTWEERHDKPVPAAKRESEVNRERRPDRPTGYVTITELCAASGMPAALARAALRASGREKPAYGWSFSENEIPEVKRICGIP